MRRSVARSPRVFPPLPGPIWARGLALLALLAAEGRAGDGDPPDLLPPVEGTIVSKPATPAPAPSPAGRRAVLALPGLTTSGTRPAVVPEVSKPAPDLGPGELTLDAPLEMAPRPGGATPPAGTSRAGRPLVLESSPGGDDLPSPPASIRPRAGSPPRRSTEVPRSTPTPAPATARRPRLFGLLPGPPVVAPPGRSVVADPGRERSESDSAAEVALKRRIERQAREVVGNRARSVEVKVAGKRAEVRVGGVKLLQRRALRKQLEGLPALSGLTSTIEVGD